ncbi:DUF2306 domain-containing protein [Paenibacillus cremeus]|uniref:DUF2306 domain-containing protein n=1 Tax=Paenibacillus cremeus TaxID=2163881 RepID=A0A559K6V5_9BACL|nr:DUF2306 domain-containing protein [Paenibacillus cremeus]TVY07813.1 DUF2306 domain-containing protein [Paenibacillus cremeus]
MKASKSWWLLLVVSLAVIIPFAAPYFTFNPSHSRVPIASPELQFPLLVGHIGLAFLALLTGMIQFLDSVRIKSQGFHRTMGRVYVCSVMLSGLLALAVIAYVDNFAKATSFLALALVWLFTTWKGYRSAVRKQWDQHRQWMIRSYGVTLVAVTGRLVVPLLLLIDLVLHGFSLPGGREQMIDEVLNVNIWVGLLVNFILIEWKMLKTK